MDQITVVGAGLGSHEEIELPRRAVPAAALRIGMFVDVPGTVFPADEAAVLRYTTRVAGWVGDDEGFARSIQIEGWYRTHEDDEGVRAVLELPRPQEREIVINPTPKIWGAAC